MIPRHVADGALEELPTAVVVVDVSGHDAVLLGANRRARALLGVGDTPASLHATVPALAESRTGEKLRRAVETGEPVELGPVSFRPHGEAYAGTAYPLGPGRCGVALYALTPEWRTKLPASRSALAAELAAALEAGELALWFQPSIEVRTGHVRGAEGLLRWPGGAAASIAVIELVAAAEESGLIHGLTHWVVEQAVGRAACWRRAGRDLTVAVNLSARNLHDPDLVPHVRDVLHDHDVPGDRIVLELTETEVMEDPPLALEVLGALGALGVRLSVDDFGTGWSSLTYLRRLPIDQLKIDRSFVGGMRHHESDDAIVRSIVELGHNLRLEVVAEGVEHTETLARLAALGCDRAQGFLVSPALEHRAFDAWLDDYRPGSALVIDLRDG